MLYKSFIKHIHSRIQVDILLDLRTILLHIYHVLHANKSNTRWSILYKSNDKYYIQSHLNSFYTICIYGYDVSHNEFEKLKKNTKLKKKIQLFLLIIESKSSPPIPPTNFNTSHRLSNNPHP